MADLSFHQASSARPSWKINRHIEMLVLAVHVVTGGHRQGLFESSNTGHSNLCMLICTPITASEGSNA